ncbi:TIGR01457 family HAD-type hydrolase [Salibacterium aidingense]|uniref:TIGR01457 family HAD-type hydrolase n=1 Tax=Salibacterium aidingense TaxID=384933 RepID=UPI0003F7FD5B|nr:TIGR01457 family HAD-type hydrolase [Salibacterium aidingense]
MAGQMNVKHYKAYLLDLDGTIYRGKEPIPEAAAFVKQLKEKRIPYLFITNNSTSLPQEVAVKLQNMGVPCEEEQVLTTSTAAASYITSSKNSPSAYVIGEEGLKEAVDQAGVIEEEDNPDYVIIGMDREITYSKLAAACLAVRNGACFISTNADKALPSERGFLPGNGALTSVISVSTGVDPVFIGKPEKVMMQQAVDILGAAPEEICLVGDNYDTDILAGIRAGMDTLHVDTGVTSREEAAGKSIPPTYAVASLSVWSIV